MAGGKTGQMHYSGRIGLTIFPMIETNIPPIFLAKCNQFIVLAIFDAEGRAIYAPPLSCQNSRIEQNLGGIYPPPPYVRF